MEFKIIKLNEEKDAFKECLNHWNFSIFDYYGFTFGPKAKVEFLNNSFNSTNGDSTLLGLLDNGKVLAFVHLSFMDWETNFFSYKIGKLSNLYYSGQLGQDDYVDFIGKVKSFAKEEGYDMIYLKTNSKDSMSVVAMNKLNFLLTDTSLDYVVDTERNQPEVLNKELTIVKADISYLEQCKEMMNASFSSHFGRYNFDPKLKGKGSEVYSSWIQASLNGYADLVLLALVDEQVAGITVWKYSSNDEVNSNARMGHYSIGAVHPEFARRKIFHDLTVTGMKLMREAGYRFIEGPTNVGNHPVQSSYSTMGWKILSAKYCYHCWL